MSDERRTATRHSVFAGNAEITGVFGRGRPVRDRARIINWSRGGVLLKVPSPRRKLLFLKNDPAVFDGDSIECTLRLAPAYKDIPVKGEVRHVAQIPKDPDHLLVGVEFDADETQPQHLLQLAKILEPRSRSGRIQKVSASHQRVSARLSAKRSSGRISKRHRAAE